MIFVPYRADFPIFRIPFFTIIVCLVCIIVYCHQLHNTQALHESTTDFCQQSTSRAFRVAIKKSLGRADLSACTEIISRIHNADQPLEEIAIVVQQAQPIEWLPTQQSKDYLSGALRDEYEIFHQQAPPSFTASLWYEPESWDIWNMLTSAFAHGSTAHLVGNLLFFVAFSVALESLIGYIFYPIVFVAIAVGTSIFYSLYAIVQNDPVPTIGLSGVVMGVMALLVFFLPKVRIRWFLWLLFYFKTFAIPAWLIALFYVGLDTVELFSREKLDEVNLVGHVSGAAIGYALGLLLLSKKRRSVIRELELAGYYESNAAIRRQKRHARMRKRQLRMTGNPRKQR